MRDTEAESRLRRLKSSLCFVNFSISWSSLANALTIRLPPMFSSTIEFSREKLSLIWKNSGKASRDIFCVRMKMIGVTATKASISGRWIVPMTATAITNQRMLSRML